jgi:hypothetical protein
MFHTEYKSAEEIEFSLGDYEKVCVLSCNVCANLSDTGGRAGLELMQGLCRGWGKEASGILVFGACVGTLMEYTMARYVEPAGLEFDAILLVSCAGGLKAANLYSPGLPVIAACDSFGSMPLTPRDGSLSSPVVDAVCPLCDDGHCVLSYTAGICPVAGCPRGLRYGFCEEPPPEGTRRCTDDASLDCVWIEIREEAAKRGVDIEALKEVERIHADENARRMPVLVRQTSPGVLRHTAGWVTDRLFNPFADILHWTR